MIMVGIMSGSSGPISLLDERTVFVKAQVLALENAIWYVQEPPAVADGATTQEHVLDRLFMVDHP